MKCYFGFALASGMFTGDCTIKRSLLTVEQVRAAIARGVISCCNSSHEATVKALQERFGLMVELPEKPPQVTLNVGEKLIVMGVRDCLA